MEGAHEATTSDAATDAAPWRDLFPELQQEVLKLSCGPSVRRLCKATKDAFDGANQMLNIVNTEGDHHCIVAKAAALSVIRNSPKLTSISMSSSSYITLADLIALAMHLDKRLRKVTGLRVDIPEQLRTLRRFTGLQHLDLTVRQGSEAQPFPASKAAAMVRALKCMPTLTYLAVNKCNMRWEPAEVLAPGLQTLTKLQHLHMADNALTAYGLRALAPALSAMLDLQTLDISSNRCYGTEGAHVLCEVLRSAPGLTSLGAGGFAIKPKGAAVLAPMLQGMVGLQHLQLRANDLQDAGVQALAPALATLSSLQVLDLSDNRLRRSAMKALQLVMKGSPVHTLNLSDSYDNPLGPSGVCALATALRSASPLQGLHVSQRLNGAPSRLHDVAAASKQLGEEGLVALASTLGALGPTLRTLQLREGLLTLAGAAALASALQALVGLTSLEIGGGLGLRGMAVIAPALTGMRRLEVLILSGSMMAPEGAAVLAQSLPALAGSLKHLSLDSCMLGREAAAALAPALAQTTSVVKLGLQYNLLDADAMNALAPALGSMRALRQVDLRGNRVGMAGWRCVIRALAGRDTLPRVITGDIRAAEEAVWQQLVEQKDVILVVR